MILSGEKEHWQYLAVKKLSALLRRIASKHHGNFYCVSCFHSFATEKKRQLHKMVCENKSFCNVLLIFVIFVIFVLQIFVIYQKSDKGPLIIYTFLNMTLK